MNSGQIFEPYDRDYEAGDRYHGKANYNAIVYNLVPQPTGSDSFGEDTFPYICYAYDSVNNLILHVGALRYDSGEGTLNVMCQTVSKDGYIKHFVSCTSDCPVSDWIGGTDRLTHTRYYENNQRYNPLNVDFQWFRYGVRARVINIETEETSYVYNIDELKALDTEKFVVEYTECRLFFRDNRTNTWGGFTDYDNTCALVNNCNDRVLYARAKSTSNQRRGLNVVPYLVVGANTQGQPTALNIETNDADTGAVIIGVKPNVDDDTLAQIPCSEKWNFTDYGCVFKRETYGSTDRVDMTLYLTVEQTLKELAFTGMIFCDTNSPTDNLYAGYIDPDGLATGELIPYEDWETTDSLNIKNKYMTDFPDLHIKPKPTPIIDEDDIESVGFGYFSNTTMGTLCALKNKLDIAKISQWLLTQTEGIDVAKNIVSIKEIPFQLSTLGIQPLDIPLTIAGHNVTYGGSNLIVGEIVAPTIPTLNIVFADFDIPRLSNTYLDYNPYTKYELLLPFAPSPVTLPDWVIDKNVKAIFLYDIYTTACQYIIICNNERICAVSGTFGIDRAIAAQNVALRDSARLSAQLGTASSVIGGVISGAVGNINGVASGAISGISAINQYINAGKQNYMYTIGANSDGSSVGLYHAAHLKITRTLSIEDESYNHTYGRPLCKTRQLSNVSGFTICGNADTSNINTATTAERNAIQQLLTSGVYL